MAFIAKNWKKNASTNAVNALLRITGAGVSALVLKKLTKNQTTAMQKTIANVSAPAVMLIGLGLDLFTEDPKIRAIGQGMYTFSALKATAVIAPTVGNAIGLSGIDDDENPIMNGLDENPIMNGLNAASSNELTESENPAEFADIQNPNAEGKVWNDVANYIEQGAENAVEVSGIGVVDDVDEYEEYEESEGTIVNGIAL